MTFCLHKIKITNFRSYKGTHVFEFPTVPGIYFFTGENLVDDIGPNGAGKSTFIDAITWCLYGMTARGLRANDVLTDWEVAGCSVELELTVGAQHSLIKRTQKPNNLTLDGNPVDQTTLESFLRLNYSAFLNSILNSQFGTSFFSLTSSVKLNLFSEIMNLDYWLKLSKEAVNQSSQLNEEIGRLKDKINRSKGEISTLEADLSDLKRDESDFNRSSKRRRNSLFDEQKLLQSQRDLVLKSMPGLADECSMLRTDLTNAISLAERAEKVRDRKISQIQSTAQKIAVEEDRLKRVPNFGEKCPTCGSLVSGDELAAYQRHRTRHENNIEFLKKEHASQLQTLVKLKSQCQVTASEVSDLGRSISKIEFSLSEKKTELKTLESKIASIAKQIKESENQKNPYAELRIKKSTQLEEARRQVESIKQNITALENEYEAVSFWIKGFKRIRLFIIEQAFQALELEVNNCLSQLGLQEWSITFDIERENASGRLTKGFMVFVKSPRNKHPVRWENWSGGETQRLQLAGDIGLSNLIMHQAGLHSTIEFFDEPSTHLSQEGMLDLANMLHERALNENKAIWIVDHAAIQNFGDFQGIIKVRKDKNGSSLSFAPP